MAGIFEHHLNNIPHLVGVERDTDRYLRAFAAMIVHLDDGGVSDADAVLEAARDTIRFISDDAFRRGFEACHENLVEPLKDSTINREAVLDEMRRHGERVCQTIVAKFEEAPGVPNQITVEIEEVELPEPKLEVPR